MPYAASSSFLLSQIGATSARLFAEHLEPLGLSPRAFAVLSNLDVESGQSQQRLADDLGMHRNNMVGLADELEKAGWIGRERDPDDRRAFRLVLTRSGAAVLDAAYDLVTETDRELLAGLTRAQKAQLRALLRATADGLGLRAGVHPHLARPR